MIKQLVLPGCLFLVLCLCRHAVLGQSTTNDSPETVFARVGGHAVLPCWWDKSSEEVVQVEWSKEGLDPNVVLLYRDGCETHSEKHPHYEFRSNLFMKELPRRNISLRISDVQPGDEGTYHCRVLPENKIIKTVQLSVGAASQSKVSITTKTGSDGVTLQCEATCWLPKPEVEWLDDQEKVINSSTDSSTDPNVSDCETVRSNATVQKPATNSRFICRVRQPEINETRDTEIIIPDNNSSADCTKSCTVACVLSSITLLAIGVVGVCIGRKMSVNKVARTQTINRRPSNESTDSNTTREKSLLCGRDQASPSTERIIEQLRNQVADLQSQLRDKDGRIRDLSERLDRLKSLEKDRNKPNLCQHGQPPIAYNSANSASTIDFAKSSPDCPNPCRSPTNHSPHPANLTHDNDPKSRAPSYRNYPKPSSTSQNEGPKHNVPLLDTDPTPISPSHDRNAKSGPLHHSKNLTHSNGTRHSTTSLPIAAAGSAGSDSANPLQQKQNHRGRTMSLSVTGPHSTMRPSRIHSFSIPVSNSYSPLAETDNEL